MFRKLNGRIVNSLVIYTYLDGRKRGHCAAHLRINSVSQIHYSIL